MRFKQTVDGNWMPEDWTPVSEQEPIDYEAMTDEQLMELAVEKGIDPTAAKTRDKLIKLLEKQA